MQQDILSQVQSLLNDYTITLTTNIRDDLNLDSLDTIMKIEDHFHIKISDDEADTIYTINDAINLITLNAIHPK